MFRKPTTLLLFLLAAVTLLPSCDDDDSYAKNRRRERRQIQSFLKHGCEVVDSESGDVLLSVKAPIKVISESEFYAADSTTDVTKNEYVLFRGSGIYMQIVRKGTGTRLQEGENTSLICRYTEFNIATDSIQTSNNVLQYAGIPDVMTVQNNLGVITGSFLSGVMRSAYSSASVPSGWLYPLQFVNIGRQTSEDDEVSLVRVIVPSTEGQRDASNNIYACLYEISYQRGR